MAMTETGRSAAQVCARAQNLPPPLSQNPNPMHLAQRAQLVGGAVGGVVVVGHHVSVLAPLPLQDRRPDPPELIISGAACVFNPRAASDKLSPHVRCSSVPLRRPPTGTYAMTRGWFTCATTLYAATAPFSGSRLRVHKYHISSHQPAHLSLSSVGRARADRRSRLGGR